VPRPKTGPAPHPQSGPVPRPKTGPAPRPKTGPVPQPQSGGTPQPQSGGTPQPQSGGTQRPPSGETALEAPPRHRPGTIPLTSKPLVNPHLRSDPRLRGWIIKAVVTLLVFIGFTIGISWRIGLTAAVIYFALDTFFRSRTTAAIVPPSVRVTSAQRYTRRRLKVLQSAGYLALHARNIPGTKHVIDHVVIGPAGVFTLDSQRLDKRLQIRVIGGMLYYGKESMEPRLDHAQHEAGHAAKLIGSELRQRIRVRPAMVLYGPAISWVVMSVKGVDVFEGSRIGSYFRKQSKTTRGHQLDAKQIAMVYAAAERALPPLPQAGP
jgi:hypothetical protein